MKKTLRTVYTMVFMLIALSANAQVKLSFTPSKTTWATLGDAYGETVGKVSLTGTDAFDHIEAEMRCEEDPDQYITFINMYSPSGDLRCATGEGWKHQLYSGYHYTLTIKAFDEPYYGVAPITTKDIAIVGEGITAPKYTDISITKVNLKRNEIYMDGYEMNGLTFDVTFSAPLAKVNAWWAKGLDGSENCDTEMKSSDGKVWTIIMPASAAGEEGSINIQVTGWTADGTQVRGQGGEHSFPFNIVTGGTTGINTISSELNTNNACTYNLSGQRVANNAKGIVVVNGKKMINK